MRKLVYVLAVYFMTGAGVSLASENLAMLDKGEYLAKAADCVACHTAPGKKSYAGGLAFELPFGTLYSPNITPDEKTGIGGWTDEQFVKALQKGISPDGDHYYPAFPYTSYTKMSREDIVAIKAYLFSLDPVDQPPQKNDIAFPFNQRWGMYFWNLVFLDEGRFEPNPAQSDVWNRGAYLVTGPGHCGECHTPRNLFQAMDASEHLAGADLGGWRAYNISGSDSHGVGMWTEDQLMNYFRQGYSEGLGVAGGPMSEVIELSLKHLNDQDLTAIATYLKQSESQTAGLPRPSAAVDTLRAPERAGLGSKVFAEACASCHQWSGKGNQSPAATLSGLKTVHDPQARNLMGILMEGNPASSLPVNHRMPDFGTIYNDHELSALTTFVLQHFGDLESKVTPDQIRKRRAAALH